MCDLSSQVCYSLKNPSYPCTINNEHTPRESVNRGVIECVCVCVCVCVSEHA